MRTAKPKRGQKLCPECKCVIGAACKTCPLCEHAFGANGKTTDKPAPATHTFTWDVEPTVTAATAHGITHMGLPKPSPPSDNQIATVLAAQSLIRQCGSAKEAAKLLQMVGAK